MIWRQGYPINKEKINKMLNTKYFRLMIQINKNALLILTKMNLYLYANATKYGIRFIDYSEPSRK